MSTNESLPTTVSVIIPTYNRASSLAHAIRSALRQSLSPLEIIVVDDGSTDDTRQCVERFANGNVRYIYQENSGVAAARNRGVQCAQGNVIAFLDSDDRWHPAKLEKQTSYMARHPDIGMVLTDVLVVDEEDRVVTSLQRRQVLPRDGHILEHVLLHPSLFPSTVAVYKDLFVKVGGFDESLPTAEDLDFHMRFARNYKIGLVESPLTTYLKGESGLSNMSRTYDDHVFVVERFLSHNEVDKKLASAVLFRTYIKAASGKCWNHEVLQAISYLRKATVHGHSFQDLIILLKSWLKIIRYL